MSTGSKIEWTEATWNPVTGCTGVSPGCKHCYARRMTKRLQAMGQKKYARGWKVKVHEDVLSRAFHWKKPRLVFVCSMSDLFHPKVPDNFIRLAFAVMRATPRHTYQVLTKRAERLGLVARGIHWPLNVWAGVSVETAAYLGRLDYLRCVPAPVRFVSFEPLLGPMGSIDLRGIHWVIVGGESGPGARPMDPAWAIDIWDQCRAARVPFFFKQWGGTDKKKAGRLLEGRLWGEMPRCLHLLARPGSDLSRLLRSRVDPTLP